MLRYGMSKLNVGQSNYRVILATEQFLTPEGVGYNKGLADWRTQAEQQLGKETADIILSDDPPWQRGSNDSLRHTRGNSTHRNNIQ